MGIWGELIGFVLKFVPAQYTAIFDKFKMSRAAAYSFIDCALLKECLAKTELTTRNVPAELQRFQGVSSACVLRPHHPEGVPLCNLHKVTT